MSEVLSQSERLAIIKQTLHSRKKVSSEACGQLRQKVEQYPMAELEAAFDLNEETIKRHAKGECDCETTEPPREYRVVPKSDSVEKTSNISPPNRILSAEDCEYIRRKYGNGVSPATLSTEFGAHQDTIRNHATGWCTCATDEPPRTYKWVVADA